MTQPNELWRQADKEFPHNAYARKVRYNELMREHGHIVDGEGGMKLPCGVELGKPKVCPHVLKYIDEKCPICDV